MSYVWYVVVEKYQKNSEDQKTNVSESSDVLDMILMSTGLEIEKHKENFVAFMNVLVSQM